MSVRIGGLPPGNNFIRVLPPKNPIQMYATHFLPPRKTICKNRCPICKVLTNPSESGKVRNMNQTKLERGQIRRWTLMGLSQYSWEVVAVPGDPNPPNLDASCRRTPSRDGLGRYLKPGEKFGRKDASVPFTTADEAFMLAHSEIVPELFLDINVTQEDIDSGTCGSFTECAISRAALRAVSRRFRRWHHISVQSALGLTVKANRDFSPKFWTKLPKVATDFINTYDMAGGKEKAKPFKFRLALPPSVVGRTRTKIEFAL